MGKYSPFMGKKEFDRNHPWGSLDIEIITWDVKSAVLNTLDELKETTDNELKEIRETMYDQHENIN